MKANTEMVMISRACLNKAIPVLQNAKSTISGISIPDDFNMAAELEQIPNQIEKIEANIENVSERIIGLINEIDRAEAANKKISANLLANMTTNYIGGSGKYVHGYNTGNLKWGKGVRGRNEKITRIDSKKRSKRTLDLANARTRGRHHEGNPYLDFALYAAGDGISSEFGSYIDGAVLGVADAFSTLGYKNASKSMRNFANKDFTKERRMKLKKSKKGKFIEKYTGKKIGGKEYMKIAGYAAVATNTVICTACAAINPALGAAVAGGTNGLKTIANIEQNKQIPKKIKHKYALQQAAISATSNAVTGLFLGKIGGTKSLGILSKGTVLFNEEFMNKGVATTFLQYLSDHQNLKKEEADANFKINMANNLTSTMFCTIFGTIGLKIGEMGLAGENVKIREPEKINLKNLSKSETENLDVIGDYVENNKGAQQGNPKNKEIIQKSNNGMKLTLEEVLNEFAKNLPNDLSNNIGTKFVSDNLQALI